MCRVADPAAAQRLLVILAANVGGLLRHRTAVLDFHLHYHSIFCLFWPSGMTIRTLDIGSLKRAKNAVIGNPHAKATLAQDDQFLELSVNCATHNTYRVEPCGGV